jgi:HAD superfamily hydrolase (TIGR01509 family)
MIKGVFFDLGGTLYSYSTMGESVVKLLNEFSEKLSLANNPMELIGYYQAASKDADHHYANQTFYLFENYFKSIFVGFTERLNHPSAADHSQWFYDRQLDIIINDLALKPHCHETLAALKAKGLYLSIVSNSDDDMLRTLVDNANLDPKFNHWTSSEAAKSCKPDPGFFEVALAKAGLQANEIIFVGDSLEQDILGAHAMGMTTVLISEDGGEAPMHIGKETPEPDYQITDLQELINIIDKH